jgi:hypothetical protein
LEYVLGNVYLDPDTTARNPVRLLKKFGAPAGQVFDAIQCPPGLPTVWTVMILPRVAVNEILSVISSPAFTPIAPKLKIVSPAAAVRVVATIAPFLKILKWAVTVESASIHTLALFNVATPEGTVNVCEMIPPGIESGLSGLPRHIAWPTRFEVP